VSKVRSWMPLLTAEDVGVGRRDIKDKAQLAELKNAMSFAEWQRCAVRLVRGEGRGVST